MQHPEIKVLNNGFVKLIDYMGDDLSPVRSARVSYKGLNDEETLNDKNKKLIRSLIERNHTSPFESVTFTFAVKAPIFVFRQWHRHRTWSFNEVSARYKELPEDFYIPDEQMVGMQMKHEKQMRDLDKTNPSAADAVAKMMVAYSYTYNHYDKLLQLNVPRELARCILPVGIYSEMYATVNLHNLIKFLQLRLDKHAQYEIWAYAAAMHDLAYQVVPYCMECYDEIYEWGE